MTSSEVRDLIFRRPTVEVSPYRIASTLAQAFKDFQAAQSEQCLRLCSHNLLVVCQTPQHARSLAGDLEELLTHYPGRAMVVVLDPDHQGEVAGFLSVFSRRQVLAGELIGLHFPADGAPLPSLLTPLFRDGLPTVILWRGRPPYGEGWFRNLIESSTRLVVDDFLAEADSLESLVGPLLPLWQCLHDPYLAGQSFADLQWRRLSIWREWVASLFDRSDRRAFLRQVDGIELESWAVPGESLPGLPVLYLAAWLIRQLGWTIESSLQPAPGGYVAVVNGFPMRFFSRSSSEGELQGRPVRVTFLGHCGQEPFRLSVERDSTNSSTLVLGGSGPCFPEGGQRESGHRLHLTRLGQACLLGQELETDARDRVFERALETLLQLCGLEHHKEARVA